MNQKSLLVTSAAAVFACLGAALLDSQIQIRQLEKELAWWRCERQYAQPQEPVLVEEVVNAHTHKE